MDDAKNKSDMQKDIDSLRSDLRQISADLASLTRNLGQKTAKEAADIEARLRQSAQEAKSTLEDQVRDKPLGTLLIALFIGLVLGKATSR